MIYNLGSINLDHFYRVPHFVAPGETLSSTHYELILGGKGLNQSVAIAQAQQGVKHIGAIGAKDKWLLDSLKNWKVDTQFIQLVDSTLSGHTMIQVDEQGENAIVLYPGANHAITLDWLTQSLEQAAPQDWLLLQNECVLLKEAIDLATAKKMFIALNPAPMTPAIAQLPLSNLDLLIVNEIELQALLAFLSPHFSGSTHLDALQALSEQLPQTTIVATLGSQGALLSNRGSIRAYAAHTITVCDTTGAGDTFMGFYLASFVETQDCETAMKIASAAAALCVTRSGAARSIPSQSEVYEFMASHKL